MADLSTLVANNRARTAEMVAGDPQFLTSGRT